MPSYFYHIALELFAHSRPDLDSASQPSDPSNPTSLPFDSACEALLPFQKRPRLAASSRSARPLLSEKSQCSPSTTVRSSSRSSSSSDTASISTHSTAPPLYTRSTISASEAEHDHRLDKVTIQCIDMVAPEQDATASKRLPKRDRVTDNPVATGIGADILGGLRTKGRYIALDQQTSDSVWGIVHLYRDAQETPYLSVDEYPADLKGSAAARQPSDELGGESRLVRQGGHGEAGVPPSVQPDEDCTTLCILAVPSYLSPSDFLGFVGEATLDDVSHFRMIRTARANRYMVLMKFRSGKKAREWQRVWNGKVFNSMEVSDACRWMWMMLIRSQAGNVPCCLREDGRDPGRRVGTAVGCVSQPA